MERAPYREEEAKRLSQELFRDIKPVCIELSQIALLPPSVFDGNSTKLVRITSDLTSIITTRANEYANKGTFVIAQGLADYIFFPISGLLKQSSLAPQVIGNILKIIDFLLRYCWIYNLDTKLVNQLFPLVIFLVGGDLTQTTLNVPIELKLDGVKLLSLLIHSVPETYFDESKLPLLGNLVTLHLNLLDISSCSSDEEISFITQTFSNLKALYRRLSSNQLSQVLPGTISHLVNFTSQVNLIHYTIIVDLINLLKFVTIKVFNDDDLKISFDLESYSLESFAKKWNDTLVQDDEKVTDSSKALNLVDVQLNDKNQIRTKSWLAATSAQLKISLTILFKNLMMKEKNRIKIKTKSQIGECIVFFVSEVITSCFISLFEEFFPLAIDIISLYISIVGDDSDSVKRLALLFVLPTDSSDDYLSKKRLILKLIKIKLQDLVDNVLPIVMKSSNDDKVNNCLVSIKLQIQIASELIKIIDEDHSFLEQIELKIFDILQSNLSDNFATKKRQVTKKPVIENDSENKLDDIELPPYINAKQVTKVLQPSSKLAGQATYNVSLVNFSKQLRTDIMGSNQETLHYFANNFSTFIEQKLSHLIEFFSSINTTSRLDVLESLLGDGPILQNAVGLWIANRYLKKSSLFKIDDFLQFDLDESLSTDLDSETSYFILSRAQELIDRVHDEAFNTEELGTNHASLEFSYAVALDTIGNISKGFTLQEFQTDFMIEYLLPILEAMTMNQKPLIQTHAVSAIKQVVNTFYDGSLEKLLVDNLDYLIDAINLKLASSDLTPSLPGILMVLIRFAGINLLHTNQLIDIMNQIFITIDTYHGYSRMVEGYFIVFDELTRTIRKEYSVELIENTPGASVFKPWGMNNVDKLVELISNENKVEEIQYDSNETYFEDSKLGQDSDDESEEEGLQEEETQEVWLSNVPKNTYNLAQTIFTYGFKLLSQNENSLKLQILKTILDVYPILCTNYRSLTIQMINEYPILLSLVAGTTSLSTYQIDNYDAESLVGPALELGIEIIKQDDATDRRSFNRQFMDGWSFLKNHSPLFRKSRSDSVSFKEHTTTSETSLVHISNPKLRKMYSKYLLLGINCYNKSIPDVTKMEMIQFCIQQGLPEDIEYCQETKNIIWVLKYRSH